MKELITVVIPNYNKAKYIQRCVSSVVRQTYPHIEIIVVDDCSTDESIENLKNVVIGNRTIKVIQNENNSGVSYCRNIGITKATGKYVTTLDSDDVFIDVKKLEYEHRILQTNTNLIAFSNIVMIDENDNVRSVVGNVNNIKEGNIFEGLLSRSIFIPRDFLCRKELYINAGLYNESMSLYEDWDLKIRLSKIAEWKYTGITGIGYRRIQGEGLSSKPVNEHNQALQKIYSQYVSKK